MRGDGDWRPLQGFIFQDPPTHSRFRRLLAPHFTMRRMAAFRPRIEEVVNEQLDALQTAGSPADLVKMFAPISLLSQCALLGIPAVDAERFFRLTTAGLDETVTPIEEAAAWHKAYEYIGGVVRAKRAEPGGDDVLSDIIRHTELTDDEITDTAFSIFQGGLESTGDMLVLAVFVLLCHPEQLSALRADPSRIDNAVEELFRYVSINHVAVGETALVDVDLDGTLIRKGETVIISLAQANRDPRNSHGLTNST